MPPLAGVAPARPGATPARRGSGLNGSQHARGSRPRTGRWAAKEVRMKPMPEDWDRAVAVVAHPDDLEYGAAAAVARWTGQGKQVAYVIASSGEAGIAGQDPVVVGPLREAEERRSAAIVGVSEVLFLGHPD